jgi:type I restriction enzyme M protein
MSTDHTALVAKVWNYAHVLRDQGIGYGDYVEQITFLLFLKMDQERTELGEPSTIPALWRWDRLAPLAGDDLERHYRHALENLAREDGLIGTIFRGAQNKLTDPAKLKRVVSLIDAETWIGIGVDVKGAIYEGLLERNAAEVKSGAGQYFTPRPLIQAMVTVLAPKVGETVHDPACGTGGFLLAAYEYLKRPGAAPMDRAQQRRLREATFSGVDIVDEVVRLAAMNLYLHGIGEASSKRQSKGQSKGQSEGQSKGESPIRAGDALATEPAERFDVVLTNPPFGKKSSYRVVGEDGALDSEREDYERSDFKFTTGNKQLNFMQHIMTVMAGHGRAAVVLPDNVLFEAGSAGEGIRRRLLEAFDFHTLLRLPTGIFYKPGVKANVLFFDKRPPRADGVPHTQALWIYDLRTNCHFTLKKNPLAAADLHDFVALYQTGDRSQRQESERFRRFAVQELLARDKLNLDIFWLKDESLDDVDQLPAPDVIAAEIVENLQAALEAFQAVAEELAPAR